MSYFGLVNVSTLKKTLMLFSLKRDDCKQLAAFLRMVFMPGVSG